MIAHIIPTMDQIDAMLKDSVLEPLSPSVKHVLSFACKLMDKYYSKTDLSNVYRIAMDTSSAVSHSSWLIIHSVLHPQLKLKYFQQHGWLKHWVSTMENIVREEFTKYDLPWSQENSETPPTNVCDFLCLHCCSHIFRTSCRPR